MGAGNFKAVFTQQEGELCLVRLMGELDLGHAAAFRERLFAVANQTVVVDLSELSFIDSSGLAAFVFANNRAIQLGHELVVTQPQPQVKRAFELTGLNDLIEPSVAEWREAGPHVPPEGTESASS